MISKNFGNQDLRLRQAVNSNFDSAFKSPLFSRKHPEAHFTLNSTNEK